MFPTLVVYHLVAETSPAYMRGGSCSSPTASSRLRRGDRFLVGIGRTFEPTRSGTGSSAGATSHYAHASGQRLPLIRTLLQVLHHGSQARLRTFPDVLGDRGVGLLRFQVGQQERRIEITLHRSKPARACMPALCKRLLEILPTEMAILRRFGLGSRNFAEGAASFCNYAGQMRYKHPRARSPMLRPYCFCQALNEVVSMVIVVPICAIR